MPVFEIGSFIGGLVYVSKCIISINHLNRANILNIIFARDLQFYHDRDALRFQGPAIQIQHRDHYMILHIHDRWTTICRRSLILGLLLFLSWVPIYLFYSTSTDLLDDISQRETKYATDEHTLFYEAFDSLTPLVAKAEIILNWFVLIKFTLIIIAVKGASEPYHMVHISLTIIYGS